MDCFGPRAYAFIVAYVREQALRHDTIRVVGYCTRMRGHGAAGGRLYASGNDRRQTEVQP